MNSINWNPVPFQDHFTQLSEQLSQQPFWKTALFGICLLERQWPIYERMSPYRPWGASKQIRQVLDRFWKWAATGARMSDKFLLMLEQNPVPSPKNPWDTAASYMMTGSLSMFYLLQQGTGTEKTAGELAEQNLRCLNCLLSACGELCTPKHPLSAAELRFQWELSHQLCNAPDTQKAELVARCRKEEIGSLFGERWFPDYPRYPIFHNIPKPLPVMRYTDLRYDEYVKRAKQRDERGQNAWEREKERLKLYDTWLNWPNQMPNDCDIPHPLVEQAVRHWRMPDSLAELYNDLPLGIDVCWACTEDPELVRGLFWLSARAQETCYALLEKGWPCSDALDQKNALHKYLPRAAFYAVCAGDWELAARLLQRWPKPLMLQELHAPWREVPATKVWLALIQNDDALARSLIRQGDRTKRPPVGRERRWPHMYPWIYWDESRTVFLMLLDGDKEHLKRKIIHDLHTCRAKYDISPSVLLPYDLVLWKLACRRKIDLDLPSVSEMPAALLNDVPLDGETWKLPGQAVIDQALGPQGMDLLHQWTRAANPDSSQRLT